MIPVPSGARVWLATGVTDMTDAKATSSRFFLLIPESHLAMRRR